MILTSVYYTSYRLNQSCSSHGLIPNIVKISVSWSCQPDLIKEQIRAVYEEIEVLGKDLVDKVGLSMANS